MAMSYGTVVESVIADVYLYFRLLLQYTQNHRESHLVDTFIQFISPVIGMSRKKTRYYVALRSGSIL